MMELHYDEDGHVIPAAIGFPEPPSLRYAENEDSPPMVRIVYRSHDKAVTAFLGDDDVTQEVCCAVCAWPLIYFSKIDIPTVSVIVVGV